MKDAFYQFIESYLYKHAPVVMLRLDAESKIIDMNRYARDVIGDMRGTSFIDLVVDFSNAGEAGKLLSNPVDKTNAESLLSIRTQTGEPRSFLFVCSKCTDRTWVVGRNDDAETETMTHEIYALNQQLGNLGRDLQKKNASLKEALAQVKTLQGILPICMHCHKIRNDEKTWERMELYIESHTDANFSHSICSECLNKYYPENEDDTYD
ncbi:MAG: hypothetical protein JXR76_11250 [Deltaproteobacteria bacterium]|nr:hypothetical protein [Deltaproteobacteria bacterium]